MCDTRHDTVITLENWITSSQSVKVALERWPQILVLYFFLRVFCVFCTIHTRFHTFAGCTDYICNLISHRKNVKYYLITKMYSRETTELCKSEMKIEATLREAGLR